MATALTLIDTLDDEIKAIEHELQDSGATHPYVQLLTTAPGIGWVLGYTIAAEIRRRPPLREPEEARRLHRAHAAGHPVRCQRPARATREERAQVPALGTHRGDNARRKAPCLQGPLRSHRRASRTPAGAQDRARRGDSAMRSCTVPDASGTARGASWFASKRVGPGTTSSSRRSPVCAPYMTAEPALAPPPSAACAQRRPSAAL